MTPSLQVKFAAFSARMAEAGIPFGLSCVLRTEKEQQALYAQGREPLSSVNMRRSAAGMYLISDRENVVVTHTLRSRHFPNKEGKSSAFDIQVLDKGGRPTWQLKYDGSGDGVPDYEQAARIGKAIGLDPGGLWEGFKDYPHFQEVL